MNDVKTYDPKKVIAAAGAHVCSGFDEDSQITIEPNGEGITKKVGADGEVTRSMDPDDTYNIKLVFDQMSETNKYLTNMRKLDKATGAGVFPFLLTDLRGGVLFHAAQAWITKDPSRVWGKASGSVEWEIHTGSAEYEEA